MYLTNLDSTEHFEVDYMGAARQGLSESGRVGGVPIHDHADCIVDRSLVGMGC